MTARFAIRKPEDWHLHVREGELLKAVLPFTAEKFGRAILMPNLVPSVRIAANTILVLKRHHFVGLFDYPAVLLGPELLRHFVDFLSRTHYSAERTMRSEPVPRGK
jgi:hypothetical protein